MQSNNTRLAIVGAVVLVLVAGVGGYVLGFREAWNQSLRAEAAPRGVVSLGRIKLLEQNRVSELKFALESDVDLGLLMWHDLEDWRLVPFINALSGQDVHPEFERYLPRLAAYRKAHPSPLSDPALLESMIANMEKKNPEVARELAENIKRADRVREAMVKRYAP